MKLEVTIGNQQLMFLAVFLAALLIVGLAGAYGGSSPIQMGHSAGELEVTVGGSTMTLQQAIDSRLLGNKIACPSGFTSIESQGRQLGCIQNSEEGSGTIYDATSNCFSKYGGRLPFFSELYIAMANYNLNDERDDRERIGDWFMTNVVGVDCGGMDFDDANVMWTLGCKTNAAYRCFIPA